MQSSDCVHTHTHACTHTHAHTHTQIRTRFIITACDSNIVYIVHRPTQHPVVRTHTHTIQSTHTHSDSQMEREGEKGEKGRERFKMSLKPTAHFKPN